MKLLKSHEGPFGYSDFVRIKHTVYELSSDELMKRCEFPSTLEEQAGTLKDLTDGNNFSQQRALFVPNLAHIVISLFEDYVPAGASCLELGPGPVAYAATRLLPLEDRIREFTMIEASKSYCKRIQHKAKAKGWRLINGDFHNRKFDKEYGVVFSLSALDTTGFPKEALENIYTMLRKGGIALLLQDVFPCSISILGQEYKARIRQAFESAPIRFAVENGPLEDEEDDFSDRPVLWIETSSGERLTSNEYLRRVLAYNAAEAGFDIIENGVRGAVHDVTPISRSIKRGKYTNLITSYFIDEIGFDSSVPYPKVRLGYYVDVIVLKKP